MSAPVSTQQACDANSLGELDALLQKLSSAYSECTPNAWPVVNEATRSALECTDAKTKKFMVLALITYLGHMHHSSVQVSDEDRASLEQAFHEHFQNVEVKFEDFAWPEPEDEDEE